MSGRPLDFTQRQLVAIMQAARKASFTPYIQVGNKFLKLVPNEHAIQEPPTKPVDAKRVIPL